MATVYNLWKTQPSLKGKGMPYQVRWVDDTKKQRKRNFNKRVEADRFATEIQSQLDRGIYKDPRSGNITFEEYATAWLASNHQIRESTRKLNEGFLRNHLLPAFGRTPLNRLTIEDGRRYLADDSRSPEGHKKTMIKCRQILNDAVSEGLIPSNPFATLKLPKPKKKEAQFLRLTELEQLINVIDPHFKTLIKVAGYMGLRQGEIFGLHPERVDLDKKTIRVVEQLDSTANPPVKTEPKTKASIRTVAIPNFLVGALEEQLALRSAEEFVFTSHKGMCIRKSDFIRRVFHPALKHIGREGFRFHDLRHTAVALAIDTGAHMKAIQVRMGHANIATTMDVYGHLMPNTDADLADALDTLRSEKLEEGPKLIALDSA